MKKVWSMILVAAMMLSFLPGGVFSAQAQEADAEPVYEAGYTWAFDQTVTLGKTKGLVSGDAAGTIKVMNHEGYNTLTPNRAIADGVLTTEVAANWGKTVGHGVFYQLPDALETGRIYQLSLNLYGGNEAAAMNGIQVSFGEYTDTLTGDGGVIQKWQNGEMDGMHNADAKITHAISGNLPTAADNTVQIEFVATEAMAAGSWMLVSFPLALSGSYKLGNASLQVGNYADGYTWDFDRAVTLGKTKGLVSGDAAGTVKVMNHEGNNSLTPNRAIANGVLTTEVAATWGNTVGHGVFYKLPAALEVGKSYQLSVNLYGGNEAATMNGINVSFGDYTTVLTGDGGNIQQWQSGGIDGLHNADTKITHAISGNLPTAADNTVTVEFAATEAMAAGSWMLVSFPLALSGSYKLGSVSIRDVNYTDGYTWKFEKTVDAFSTSAEFKKLYYGNWANTVGIINHEVNANYGTRCLKNGVLSTVVTAGWDKAAHGVYYKLPMDLVAGQEYVVSMNLYASAEGTPITNTKTTNLKLSFVDEPATGQIWLATGMEAYHNDATLVTYRAPDYLSTDTANKLTVSFVATQAMAEHDGWMLITFPLETGKTVNLGQTTLETKKDTANHFLNGDFSDGLIGWMTNYDGSYVSAENSVLQVSDKVPAGDVKLYQAMYLDAGVYRLSFDVLGAPTSWRPVYFMGTALDNSGVTGQLQVSQESGKTEGAWWTVTRDVTIETAGTYYFQMNVNQVSGGAAVAPEMQYDNFELRRLSVKSWNIVLGDDIGLNFVLALTQGDEVQVKVDGTEVPVELTHNEDGTYQVFIEVAAAQMTSQIELIINGQPVEKTYSVRDYADVILAGEYADSVKTLVRSMLSYGGAAQKYFHVNEQDFADRDITVAEVTVPGDDLSVAISDHLADIDFHGASLVMRSKTAVRFYFKAERVEDLIFTVNGKTYTPVSADGMYCVEVADINPQDLADVLNMVVSDGTNTLEVSYSPVIYISRMYHRDGSSDALKAMVKAMYGYYLSAKAMAKQISYQDSQFSFAGFWEENQDGELVSYKRVAMFTTNFHGTKLLVNARLDGTAKWYVDDALVEPTVVDGGFQLQVPEGEHRVKAVLVSPSRMYLRGAQTDGVFLEAEAQPYVHFIGDSITHAYPGYATAAAEALGVDYSVVAHPGMALVDGWGWYTPIDGVTERVGMESNYFQLETPDVSSVFTPHSFTYDRKPDVIVIYLGVNDYLTEGSEIFNEENPEIFANKYVNFVQRLRDIYPQTPVVLLQCHLPDRTVRIDAIADAYGQMCQLWDDVSLIDATSWNVDISSDGVHPSQTGYAQMAQKMADILKDMIGK